jgi:serine/threonine protein kinase
MLPLAGRSAHRDGPIGAHRTLCRIIAPDSAAMRLAPGTHIGPYEILSAIGAGGMGEVYRADDTRLGRTVAIKALAAEPLANEERRRRFLAEARAASALNHPNIVVIHDVVARAGARDQPLPAEGS